MATAAPANSNTRGEEEKKKKKRKKQRQPLREEDDTAAPQQENRVNNNKKKKNENKQDRHREASGDGFVGSEEGVERRGRMRKPRRPQAAAEADKLREKELGKDMDTEKVKRERRPRQDQLEEEQGRNKKPKLQQRNQAEYHGGVRAGEDEKMMKKKSKKKKWRQLHGDQLEEVTVGDLVAEKKHRNKDGGSEEKWATEGSGKDGSDPTGRRGNLITDPRFAFAHWDPRFQRMPRRESKVSIDSRFSRLFSEKSFAGSSAPVDKRGKPRKEKAENPLLRYYLHEEETPAVTDENGEEGNTDFGSDEESEPSTSGDASDGTGDDSQMSSSTDEEGDFEEDGQYAGNSDVFRFWMGNQDNMPTIENETRRLAVVNMDWDHIKAVDLYVLMSTCLLTSFPQDGGQILSVAVYPSEFGLKSMEIEAIHGPHALFDDEKDHNNDDDDDDDTDDEIVNEKIRSYQLKRLKYYYAVVDCDSSATANHLYNALDGVEFLKTANVLDLRFIPDSMEFKHPPRDIATEAPANYKQPDFETLALQHSTVKLTWDNDEPNRKKILRRKFNPEQMDELEQYLASEESDSDDESDEGHGEKYHALLLSGNASGTEEDNDSSKEMEVTFLPGVENLSRHIDKNKLEKSEEGVWEAYLRKRREKMKARKKGSKFSSEDESSDSEYHEAPHQPDDFFVEESSDSDAKEGKNGGKKVKPKAVNKKSQKDTGHTQEMGREETGEASRAELELLLANDDVMNENLKGFNLRPKRVKGKKGKEVSVEDKLPDVDASNDPRFSSRLGSNLYALDPTDPQYKRSAVGMKQQRSQKQSKGNVRVVAAEGEEKINPPMDDEKPFKGEPDIMSLVRSLKLKSKALGNSGKEDAEEKEMK